MKINEVKGVIYGAFYSWKIGIFEVMASEKDDIPLFAFVSKDSKGKVIVIESFGMDSDQREEVKRYIENYEHQINDKH